MVSSRWAPSVEALAAPSASPELRRCLAGLAARTEALLREGEALPLMVKDFRLGLELSVIQTLARHITHILAKHDPLSERVHVGKLGAVGIGLYAVTKTAAQRIVQ